MAKETGLATRCCCSAMHVSVCSPVHNGVFNIVCACAYYIANTNPEVWARGGIGGRRPDFYDKFPVGIQLRSIEQAFAGFHRVLHNLASKMYRL